MLVDIENRILQIYNSYLQLLYTNLKYDKVLSLVKSLSDTLYSFYLKYLALQFVYIATVLKNLVALLFQFTTVCIKDFL